MKGITIQTELAEGLETIVTDEGALVEGVVSPHASIAGLTLGEINFRQRFRMVVVAVHRKGTNQRERLSNLRLQAGDTLLMMGSTASIDSLANSDEIIILDRPRVPARSLRIKMPIAITTTIGIVIPITLTVLTYRRRKVFYKVTDLIGLTSSHRQNSLVALVPTNSNSPAKLRCFFANGITYSWYFFGSSNWYQASQWQPCSM